ncbi:MAG: hypothetical protein O2887_14075 [Bacteroidetes bacterium]|nr:hypothetical protein [Bacteroidota bacterium]MDA1121596.1 hypothetical protein [Bacteroidota bacterium]
MKETCIIIVCLLSFEFNIQAQNDKIQRIRQLYNAVEEGLENDAFLIHKLTLNTIEPGIGIIPQISGLSIPLTWQKGRTWLLQSFIKLLQNIPLRPATLTTWSFCLTTKTPWFFIIKKQKVTDVVKA